MPGATKSPVLPGSATLVSTVSSLPDEGVYFVPYLLRNGIFIDL